MVNVKFRKSKDKKSYTCTMSNLTLYQLKAIKHILSTATDNGIELVKSNGITLPYLSVNISLPLVASVPRAYLVPYSELNALFGNVFQPRNKIIYE